MYLKTLHLQQFRNYRDQKVVFDAPKTILVGDNAQGKSNLLEAVELLSTLKSHRVSRDRDLILDPETIGQITATLERDRGLLELAVTLRSQGRRTVMLNGESLRRQLDFLSLLNVVEFSSLDLELVRGSPERRRSWLDRLLVQLEPVYAYILHQYNQVLRQRNALLKKNRSLSRLSTDIEPKSSSSGSELAVWDAQLAVTGSRVIRRRDRVLERLTPLAQTWHHLISGSTENLQLSYQPNVQVLSAEKTRLSALSPQAVQQAFLQKISTRAIAEQQQGTSLVGPHRDDICFEINQTPARQHGSSGQQRTLVLALKLAELQLIEDVVGEPPLLLLDDVLAELDINRQNQLLEAVGDRFQTLITTTHLGVFDDQWLKNTQILSVQSGKVDYYF
ncbi:DNA replication/repair protein RecF [Limnoraphis robusta Tam1]|uniref:DNA replication/repair protein RecF n=1 Tax=Limnoraphis robusta TaxID=1118279 RepID=UPI002B21C86A|nr:DNA replication/repair protein RecF [Limnoraphis robusta]MEA5500210.1 DNA replication/repair protein RecF [Limnoraphis robusta BA-68 BA1]MEA5539676.1 DNA replication/repair protein RecF [Limnoraphis robusta Tam1]